MSQVIIELTPNSYWGHRIECKSYKSWSDNRNTESMSKEKVSTSILIFHSRALIVILIESWFKK